MTRAPAVMSAELAQLRAAIAHVASGVIMSDAEGNLLDWNPAALRLHGFNHVDDVRQNLALFARTFVLSVPDGAPIPFSEWPLSKLIRGEAVVNYELCVYRADTGKSCTISYSGTSVYLADTDQKLFVLTLHDVTASRRAAETIRQSEARFKELASAIPQIMWTANAQGYVEYFNSRWHEVTGSPATEGGDEIWTPVIHPEDHERCMEQWPRALQNGEPYETEYRLFNRRTGGYRWYLRRAVPVRDLGGNVVRWFGTCTDIDDLKRAEAAMRESELRLRGVVETAADGIITIDLYGMIESANPAMTRMFGYEAGQLIGQNVRLLTPAGSACISGASQDDDNEKNWLRVGSDRELRGRRKNGEIFPIELSVGEMRLSGRHLLTAIVRDITSRKDAERRAQDKQHLIETLVEGISDPVYLRDARGRYTYVNHAMARLADRPAEKCIGLDTGDIFGPEVAHRSQATDRIVLESGLPYTYEQSVVVNGAQHHFLVSKSRFLNADGSVAGSLGIWRDIKIFKQAEETLREGERHAREVMNSLAVVIFVLDPDHQIVEMNQAARQACASHGFDANALIGSPITWLPWTLETDQGRLLTVDDLSPALSGTALSFSGVQWKYETRISYYDVTVAPMPGAQGVVQHLIVSAVDTTAKNAAEARTREQQSQLLHLERVRTMGHLASGLAHELNQPLGAIANYAGAARQSILNNQVAINQLDDAFKQVTSEALRAGEIIRRMRAFVRKQQPDVIAVDINGLLEESIRILTYELRNAGVKVTKSFARALPDVPVDPVQMTQVLVNLVRNAIEAMENVELDRRRLSLTSSLDESGSILIHVSDTGTGVSADQLDRIFDAFYTTKPHGLGVGLALCRIILENHGGSIGGGLNDAGGMTFTLTLRPSVTNTGEEGYEAPTNRIYC